jgi:LysM repeat protein
MAVDFDFDTSYNDNDENEPEEEFDEEVDDMEEDEGDDDGDEPGGRNPLRLILLALLVLVMLCVVCWLASRFVPLPIPGMGAPPPPPAQEIVQNTPTPAAADAALSGQAAETDSTDQSGDATSGIAQDTETEADATTGEETVDEVAAPEAETETESESMPVEGEADSETDGMTDSETTEDGAVVAEEGSEGESATGAETDTGADEATEEETTIIISTPSPVAGPTATPSPDQAQQEEQAGAAASCDTNTQPQANAGGPYEVMMGKGQGTVNFDGSQSSDADGVIDIYTWDFGDGNTGSGVTVQHGYAMTGTYQATLTVTDDCGATALATASVTVTAAQPPDGTDDGDQDGGTPDSGDDDSAGSDYVAPPVDPSLGTLGFCYVVRRGDTLSGIATQFGVPLHDLAYVNGVSPQYYVIAGQGLFVPVRAINPNGPNIYQVQPGDTMYSIAGLCGVSVGELARVNGTHPDAALSTGQIVSIPPPWSY